jgi:hypothetical protein
MSTDYGVHSTLTDEALAECEALLGVRLPAEYVELLRVRNGGTVVRERSAFLVDRPTSWAPDHVPFQDCAGIGAEFPSITHSPYLNVEWGQPDGLVLLHGDGHYWVALDYRSGRTIEPSVVWFDNEVGDDFELADSFGKFLRGLTAPPPIAP